MPEYELGVTGHSDDIIHVTGDVTEEHYVYDTPAHFLVGDTEVVVKYDGEWHFSAIDKGANDDVHHHSVGRKKVVEMANDYTEALVVESDSKEVTRIE